MSIAPQLSNANGRQATPARTGSPQTGGQSARGDGVQSAAPKTTGPTSPPASVASITPPPKQRPTLEGFKDKWYFELFGILSDLAIRQPGGAELAKRMTLLQGKIDHHLSTIYRELSQEL